MVSNVKYYSGKDINIRKAVPFSVVVLISFFVILVINLADNLPELLFLTFLSYFLSGFVAWVLAHFRGRRQNKDAKE
jgi:CDP-diacylglycerol--serine O-phosphatidyltransferase